MKKTKILVPAMAVLALGMAAAVTGTVAWFSANNVVTANNMIFKSVTPSSLAIGEELTAGGIGNATSITYETPASVSAINPASHWHGSEDAAGNYYAVNNGEFIDPITGLAAPDQDNGNAANTTYSSYENITFAEVTGNQYFVEYTCYIASVGEGITIGTDGYLRATPTFTFDAQAASHSDTIYAATVDFFVYKAAAYNGEPTNAVVPGQATYVQGVNALGKDYTVGRHATYPGEVTELGTTNKTYSDVLVPGDTIPTASGNAAIMIKMLFYFDGALLKDANNAYVATNRLDTTNITVNVSFSLNRGNTGN